MTTITKDQMILKDNEVSIWSKDRRNMLYTTDKFYSGIGVIQLPREWFVRGEDVEEMVKSRAYYHPASTNASFTQRVFNDGFKAGYNAKKGEFTREQMEDAFNQGCASVANGIRGKNVITFNEYLASIHPLSLPQYLTLNKDNEIVKIEW